VANRFKAGRSDESLASIAGSNPPHWKFLSEAACVE